MCSVILLTNLEKKTAIQARAYEVFAIVRKLMDEFIFIVEE